MSGPLDRLMAVQDRDRLLLLLAGQSRVLELIAQGTLLEPALEELMRVLEQQADGMLCSVLLLSDDRRHVRHCAAPSLPEEYNRAIDGQEIGPCAGSCGTAAFTGRQVIVADIAEDPLWIRYRALALDAGLRACWSTPILSRGGEVLGTFAIYYREPSTPTPLHLQLIALATHVAGIAIERSVADRERGRLMGELEVDRRALERASRHKDQFLAMLAHELRNPLAAIGNAVEVVRLRLARQQDVEGPLAVLERQVRNSSRLLDDLLDVARFTRGLVEIQRERVRLDEVVGRAVESQRSVVERHAHRLAVSLPDEAVVVDGDAIRLEQVLANLLHNAAKYTPDGGRIEVAVERGEGEAIVRVRDDGMGISPELLPHVFDLFVQADKSLARSQGGLGLGLTLVRNLVAMHGGAVEARSEGLGKGSEFVVRLPARDAREPARRPAEPVPAAAVGRVLVVEDNVDAADTLAEALATMGHEVEVVHDGEAALATASTFRPELALVDIGLPGMDGFEVARRLRQELRERTPVLVALTGYGQEEDRERSRSAGIEVHLTKPFDLRRLERLIGELLARRAAGGPTPPLAS